MEGRPDSPDKGVHLTQQELPRHPQPRPSREGWYPLLQALCIADFRLTELQACCGDRKTPPAQSG